MICVKHGGHTKFASIASEALRLASAQRTAEHKPPPPRIIGLQTMDGKVVDLNDEIADERMILHAVVRAAPPAQFVEEKYPEGMGLA